MSTEQAIEASKVPAVFMPMRILITRSVLWIKKIKSHSQLTYIPANFKNRLLIAIKNPLSPIGQIIKLLNMYIYCFRTTQRFAHVCVCVCVCVCGLQSAGEFNSDYVLYQTDTRQVRAR